MADFTDGLLAPKNMGRCPDSDVTSCPAGTCGHKGGQTEVGSGVMHVGAAWAQVDKPLRSVNHRKHRKEPWTNLGLTPFWRNLLSCRDLRP